MSYVVLARKYRPQTFDELVGQEAVQRSLGNAIRSNKIHHAYLFTGTRGIGKTTIARIFAKCLNCETHGITDQPCGTCSACTEIQEGRFVDLIEIDAASRTKVEDTLSILENVKYAPTRGRYKIYLIDEVHMLSMHSFNALLKTLEEPPEHVKFLLATTDPQKLPITVLSRCLQYNLRKMTAAHIKSHLSEVLTNENIAFEEAGLELIAKAADGSMRDALSITDQAISYTESNITQDAMTTMLGLVQNQTIFPLVEHLIEENGQALIEKVRELSQSVPDFLELNQKLISLLHQIALFQQLPDALDQSEQLDYQRIEALAGSLAPEQVQLYYQIALNGHQDIAKAPDKQIAFEMLLLRMLVFLPEKQAKSAGVPAKKSQAGEARPAREQQPVKSTILTKADHVNPASSNKPHEIQVERTEKTLAEPAGALNEQPEPLKAQQLKTGSQLKVDHADMQPSLEPEKNDHLAEDKPVKKVAGFSSDVSLTDYLGGDNSLWLERWWQLVQELALEQNVFNFVAMTVIDKVSDNQLSLMMLQDDDIWYDAQLMKALKASLSARFVKEVEVTITWADSLPEKNLRQYQLQLKQAKQAELEQMFLNNPLVRYAIDELGGVVDRTSIKAIDETIE